MSKSRRKGYGRSGPAVGEAWPAMEATLDRVYAKFGLRNPIIAVSWAARTAIAERYARLASAVEQDNFRRVVKPF